MKALFDEKTRRYIVTAVVSGIALVLFYLGVTHFDVVRNAWNSVWQILRPFTIGFIFAYILNGPLKFFEKCFGFVDMDVSGNGPHPRLKRVLAILVTWIVAIAVVTAFFYIVIPDVKDSVVNLANSLPGYYSSAVTYLTSMAESYGYSFELLDTLKEIEFSPSKVIDILDNYKEDLLPQIGNIASITKEVGNFILDLVIAIIISVYFMFSKETLLAQGRKLVYAEFEKERAWKIVRVFDIADDIFSGFINGKLLDSLIIGILCFIGVSLLGFEYPLLISFIVGVTNIIPFFGPLFGAIPSALLLLMINPWHALWFVVFVVALQQLDGNVIGPKILGDSTGLPAIWVMFAIIVGGGIFGIGGMIIGVPTFAVIYKLSQEGITDKLSEKELPIDTDSYKEVIKY